VAAGRLDSTFSPDDLAAIAAAVRHVESRSPGEVVAYAADRSDAYPEAAWTTATLGALLGGLAAAVVHGVLGGVLDEPAAWLASPPIVGGGRGYLLGAAWPALRIRLVHADVVEHRVRQRALAAFVEQEVFRTEARPGILLFLSLLEHLFAIELAWLPVQGYQRIRDGLGGFLLRLILPSFALAIIYVALIARITRASVLEVLSADHVRTARAKGLAELPVLFRHALRNAAVPIVTVIGLGVALLIGGVVVTESVFSIPGLGRLTVDAVLARDYPTVQAVVLLFSTVYVVINLLVDLIYTFLDPRIRY
jgi:uncharacterized membrane protein